MVPAPLSPIELVEPRRIAPPLATWVRGGLLLVGAGLLAIFGIAYWLNPYDSQGQPRQMATHLQLGLPPCNFLRLTGYPCPSCGMTTSFALLVRGDVVSSLKANAAGTLLAAFLLLVIPWSLASALCRRLFFITSLERALLWTVGIFMVVLLVRWVTVLGLAYLSR